MLIIKRNGILSYTDPESIDVYDVTDNELLSFLKEPIFEVEKGFIVKDFIKIYENYPSLLKLYPDFHEVISLAEGFTGVIKSPIERLIMSICIDVDQMARAYFSLVGSTKVSESAYLNLPVQILSLKHIINSEIKISPKLGLSVMTDEYQISDHIPFSVNNFTFFDFLMIYSDNLIQSCTVDEYGFELAKQKINEMHKAATGRPLYTDEPEVDTNKVEDNTNDILDQINDLMNPPKKG
jgi:hypothetical protein